MKRVGDALPRLQVWCRHPITEARTWTWRGLPRRNLNIGSGAKLYVRISPVPVNNPCTELRLDRHSWLLNSHGFELT